MNTSRCAIWRMIGWRALIQPRRFLETSLRWRSDAISVFLVNTVLG